MFQKIKQWFQVKKANEVLTKAYGDALEKNMELVNDISPERFIKNLLKKDIQWFDFNKLSQQMKINYYADCQNIVNGETFNNELNHYIVDLIRFCATMDGVKPEDKLMVLTNVQASIVALETFRKRLESIENPVKFKPEVDPFEAL